MKILYLAHRLPYPPNKGEKIRAYHHLRHLARSHTVDLVSCADAADEAVDPAPLRVLCRRVVVVPLGRYRALLRAGVGALAGKPISVGYFGGQTLARRLHGLVGTAGYDVAWASSSVLARYLAGVPARRRVADFMDLDSAKWAEFAARARAPWCWLYAVESQRLARLEARMSAAVDAVVFSSDAEAASFRAMAPDGGAVHVVGNGVDTAVFRPMPAARGAEPPTLLFTGTLDYRPNIDAAICLMHEVLPRVRAAVSDARVLAVGHRPAAVLRRAAHRAQDRLTLAGSVPDVRPYFAAADVYVAPMWYGRGVKNKLLEAMAMGVPVVASPCAAEGLGAVPGRHLLLATTPAECADVVVGLLRDPGRARSLAAAARTWVETERSWDVCLQALDDCVRGRDARADR